MFNEQDSSSFAPTFENDGTATTVANKEGKAKAPVSLSAAQANEIIEYLEENSVSANSFSREDSIAMAKKYCVSEKIIQDIWNGRISVRESAQSDPDKPWISEGQVARRRGRPKGSKDSKPRARKQPPSHNSHRGESHTGRDSADHFSSEDQLSPTPSSAAPSVIWNGDRNADPSWNAWTTCSSTAQYPPQMCGYTQTQRPTAAPQYYAQPPPSMPDRSRNLNLPASEYIGWAGANHHQEVAHPPANGAYSADPVIRTASYGDYAPATAWQHATAVHAAPQPPAAPCWPALVERSKLGCGGAISASEDPFHDDWAYWGDAATC